MPPRPLPSILQIEPYVPGESEADAGRVVRLASNEGAFGPCPAAMTAFRAAAATLHRYPDGGSVELRRAIGRRYGYDPARLVCGNGSDELIALLIKAFAAPGDEVLHSQHGFLMYALSAKAAGAVPVSAPEIDLRADVDAILARASERTKLVFLANPNNPTGSHLAPHEVARLRAGLPADALLVIDAAYAEYVERNDYTPGDDLVDAGDNTVMLRTFSKIYGLAALRLGWLYGPPGVVDVLNRVRGPFNVNAAAQAAGIAAIGDIAFVDMSRRHNEQARERTARELAELGFHVWPSVANFVLVDLADFGADAAVDAAAFLKRRGILVRRVAAYGLPGCLRVGIGTDEEMAIVVDGFRAFRDQASA
ncbi:MAG: histidinol-phosphate transaminase [Rhodospirillaceae bacterium]|nr:histidinol-phosphate transaminase [Rhodospirillaceae bacterium]